MRAAVLILVLGGCGRLAFDPLSDGGPSDDGGSGSATGDAFMPGMPQYGQYLEVSNVGQSTITANLPQALRNNDFIFVSIGIEDATTAITSVTDTAGSTFTAGGPQVFSGGIVSQQLWSTFVSGDHATESITATLNAGSGGTSLRVVVYRYVGQPVTYASNSGMGTAATVMLTCGRLDLSVSADTASQPALSPGVSYGTRLSTAFGDLVIDRICPATGIATPTINLGGLGSFVMQSYTLPHQ